MESVRKLETSLARWYKQWPHLPTNVARFLGEWAWLFVFVGAILSVLSILVFWMTFFNIAFVSAFTNYATTLGQNLLLSAIVSLLFSIIVIYFSAIAIMPLKEKRKKGWNLIYYVMLINFAAAIISAVLSYNLFGIVWAVIWAVIGGFFLFEVRGYFMPHTHTVTTKK